MRAPRTILNSIVVQASVQIVNLATVAWLARALPGEQVASFLILLAATALPVLALDGGISTMASRAYTAAPDRLESGRLLWDAWSARLLLVAPVSLLVLLLWRLGENGPLSDWRAPLVCILLAFGLSARPTWAAHVSDDSRRFLLIELLASLAVCALALTLAALGASALIVVMAMAMIRLVSAMLSTLVMAAPVRPGGGWQALARGLALLRGSAYLTVQKWGSAACHASVLYVIAIRFGNDGASAYAMAERATGVALAGVYILSSACYAAALRHRSDRWGEGRVVVGLALAGLALSAVLVIAPARVLDLYLGRHDELAVAILVVIGLLPALQAFNGGVAFVYLISRGRDRMVSLATVGTGTVSIGWAALMAVDARQAAWASVLGETLMAIVLSASLLGMAGRPARLEGS